MMMFMWLFWLIVVVAAIAIGVALFRRSSLIGSGPEQHGPTAEETVRQRYAAGQIDRETYERMLEDLRRGSSPPTSM